MTDILVFYSMLDPFEEWRDAIATHLGTEIRIERADAVSDPSRVRFALVWNPPTGFFDKFPNLELVINLGAGVDRLVSRADLPDIPITRLSDPEMGKMMAGFVLFSVLRHAREIPHFEAAQRNKQWSYRHPRSASDINVTVLGLGELGGLAATEIARQGFRTHGWATRPRDLPGVEVHYENAALHDLLANADIVVCMLPLTPATSKCLDAAAFAAMKPGAAFVNVSRGEVVEERALVAALQSGKLSGATLDVFASEPLPPEHALWTLPGVLITPHLASVALPKSAAPQIAFNINAVRSGAPLANVVSKLRGY
ncbi:2-hydroxyacid dehydrogenase [Pelagibacterium halotolerans]|uniref:D-3-phosphoglycerate dehydrogenase n=1 Tax=Pelagibacterium halotolerans (strain DSM 22347 / JCM 15775 / CGMCC 1.7692 / B2) TaxID=1082931 RepID=G4RCG5_PELHB|nr:glyoxylate/hydroxypyruvate reductase A [Pelagibacterium halotolerans]AEQ53759.1 D-3-phosphoglycerate dehydrogenase [Pelagibacterium halotolerans B2]QJR20081.1 glyoxylate/hydroxypyruvate reductase A [Pelagibacterium halotolerans]SEA80396.1 glyoxylate/hydroxypyruvate reductase A [Pelagibacterium halotolerans]